MSKPEDVEPEEVFSGLSLGRGMSLGGLGRALSAGSGALMDEISSHIRRLTDLPADVYRHAVDVPDERGVRDHLAASGSDVLAVVVPVVRTIVSATEVVPGGPLMQPVMLGKVFGVHDYVHDRKAALEALPELPAELKGELMGAADFVRAHGDHVEAATRALPPASAMAKLGSVDFWKESADEEWKATCARIDGHYEAVTKKEDRRRRDLPIFRAAYALAYFTLGKVDPVAGTLAKVMPSGVAAYQRFATHRERFGRVVERLKEAEAATPSPEEALAAARERPAVSRGSRPASVGLETPPEPSASDALALDAAGRGRDAGAPAPRPRAAALPASLGALGPRAGLPMLDLPAGGLSNTASRGLGPVAATSLATRPLPASGISAPPASGPPGLAPRLHLKDPGLGEDPKLAPAPPPRGATAQDLPTGPMAPAAQGSLPTPRAPASAQANLPRAKPPTGAPAVFSSLSGDPLARSAAPNGAPAVFDALAGDPLARTGPPTAPQRPADAATYAHLPNVDAAHVAARVAPAGAARPWTGAEAVDRRPGAYAHLPEVRAPRTAEPDDGPTQPQAPAGRARHSQADLPAPEKLFEP